MDEFINEYSRLYDHYREVSQRCAQRCTDGLAANAIRAIVTYRAKAPERLRGKVERLDRSRSYTSTELIRQDIGDLAGVRIALYFPGDELAVRSVIGSLFELDGAKTFPARDYEAKYNKRFAGYWAVHYYVRLKDSGGDESRFARTPIEIQVASILMHAWAEVEHDLVYKPLSGELSEEEYAILDELNGVALAGEIALTRLQQASKGRVGERGKAFPNHYDVASYLYEVLRAQQGVSGYQEPVMNGVDLLWRFLEEANLNRPEAIETVLGGVRLDAGTPSVPEQVMLALREKDRALDAVYERVVKRFAPNGGGVGSIGETSAS